VQARAAAMRKPVGALVRAITTFALVLWIATVAASAVAAAADGGASTTTSVAPVAAANVSVQPLSCGILPRNLTQCQMTDCAQRMRPLIPCLDYLRDSAPLPSATCCLGLQQLKVASSMCFCDVSFYPPPGFNISLALQQAMPAYCNITVDLCSFCPSQLISSSAAQDNPTSALCGSAPAPGNFMMSCTTPGSSQYSFPCHSIFCSCSSLSPSLQH
jgi:hypothetical protein